MDASIAGKRHVYRHEAMRRLVSPRSIAVVGASPRAGSFGLRTLTNLSTFKGAVYPVNARYRNVAGLDCHASIAALPEVPDCAVIAVSRDLVEAAVAECVAAGVGGVIVYASGYSETRRPEYQDLQARLVRMVEGTQTRLAGPNSMGVNNYAAGALMTFGRMPEPRPLAACSIGIVAQSGGLCMSLSQAMEHGVSISHAVTVGNAADVGIADFVSYLAGDPSCHAIACVFEGIADPARLLEAAEIAWTADKPVVVYKMATGEKGAATALSHTGFLAGSDAAYRAAFERAGFAVVDRLEDVVEITAFLAKAGRARGIGAGVASTSGGGAVMAADKAEVHGVQLPPPSEETLVKLRANVPEFGSAGNPCDMTAQVLNDENVLSACAEAMLADPSYSALVVHHTFADEVSTRRLPLWSRLATQYGKMVCNYWSAEWLEGPGALESETSPGLATFRSMDRCFAALAAWQARETRRATLEREAQAEQRKQRGQHPESTAGARIRRDAVAALLAGATQTTLVEREAKNIIQHYGIPVVSERLVHSAQSAVEAARELGLPVVMKLESPDVAHKSDAGVVLLNLKDEGEVREAYERIMETARAIVPQPRIAGVLVQPMLASGVEVILGMHTDPVFGPLVVVGLGGIFVELLEDTAVGLAPVSHAEAQSMLRRLRGQRVLAGFRGGAAVDLDRLADMVCRFSQFAADHAGAVAEADVNPLICDGGRMVAVDALIVRRGAP